MKKKNVPFSIQYKKKMKQKRELLNNALNRREKILFKYWKRHVKEKSNSKKDEPKIPEKDCPKN